LIGKESNIIIVRGGNRRGRPVYEQMVTAMEEYFPESSSGLIEGPSHDPPLADASPLQPVRRTGTGISSIVGADNGERPGGFILVIDGPALDQVRSLLALHSGKSP
jgi:phospholipid-translocating ATPase